MFKDFNDFCETFELCRGKDDDDEESNVMGEFKVCVTCIHSNRREEHEPCL